jgi:drug/metabolite transporter (DMT)-like permease
VPAVVAAYAGMCAIWGTTWLAIKLSLAYIPPITGAGLRFVVAGLFLYAIAALRGRLTAPARLPWKVIAVFAIALFGLNYVLNYIAETRLDSGLVSVLFGTLPFFVFALGAFAHERTTPRIWIGAGIAFAGVALISLVSQVRGSPLFALAPIGAAASSAFANVYAKRHAHHDPLVTLPPSMLLAGIAMTMIGLTCERVAWDRALAPGSIATLLYLALLGSSLTFFLNMWVIKRLAVWIVGLSSLIIPVIAVGVGIVFGGEHVTSHELLGAAFVIAGLAVALTGQATNIVTSEP